MNKTSRARSSVLVPIPETFSEVQAESILAIKRISASDRGFAQLLLRAWTPERFSGVQAKCIQEMLRLSAEDLRATLADAMEPCDLRQRLRSRCTELLTSGLEVDSRHARRAIDSLTVTRHAQSGGTTTSVQADDSLRPQSPGNHHLGLRNGWNGNGED